MKAIQVGKWGIGPGHPALIIGEVAQAHDGSLGLAHAFIDAIAEAGADAVKFQTHIAAAESTRQESFRVKFSSQDATRYDYWKRMEFSEAQWRDLFDHAQERGLLFLSSPFSVEAVELLERLGVPCWKIGSGEVSNWQMLARIRETGKPVLLSSGMSSWEEHDRAVDFFRSRNIPLALFQCTSSYPTSPAEVGLNLMEELRARYEVPVGLSDHSGKIYAGLAAAALEADMLEVHVTLSREMFGPDVSSSLTTAELRQLVEGVRFIEAMKNAPLDKDQLAQDKAELRGLFFHSLVAKEDLAKGTELRAEHLAAKKPGTGIPTERMQDVVGRKLARDVQADHLLSEEDLV